MSQVSHDSIWVQHYGATDDKSTDSLKKETGGTQEEEIVDNAKERDNNGKVIGKTIEDFNVEGHNVFDHNDLKKEFNHKNDEKETDKINIASKKYREIISRKNANDITCKKNTGKTEWKKIANCKNIHTNVIKWKSVFIIADKKINIDEVKSVKKEYVSQIQNIHFTKRALKKRNLNQVALAENKSYAKTNVGNSFKKKTWQKQMTTFRTKDVGKALKRTNDINKRPKWSLNSGILVALVMLNLAGLSNAIDASEFTSALTSRMIASFLGYPTTCSLGAEVRPCTLTFTCWLRGGTRLRGCGGWLFSCCGPPEPSREEFDNSIASSDWKYKVSPPKLRQVPQRSVMPNNVFRRRVDDDVSQMDCGLPSSKILQKRIIGGREARFAEFPWQAHVRISEFQCGGVLVSRRFVATAAHCVSRARPRDVVVWLGAVDTSATHHPARKLGVIQKILHPLFQFRMTQPDRYDIALLKLSRPITYMSHILPICLPDYDMELRGRSGVIAGWGKTDASNGHTGTNLLRSATVPILSKEQCINWHQSKQISVEIHSEMICAGHSDGHQDACLGDSGGPLIVLDNGRYYLVGITSAGFGCGVDHQPGIYHNVKLTANWIRGVISPSVNYIDN